MNGLATLGRKARPQSNPAIPPPRWPIPSVCALPAMRLKMIMMITIAMSMHLTYSNYCPLNSYQLTQIIAKSPNKIPKSEVEAPMEGLDGSVTELNRFPPILNKINKWMNNIWLNLPRNEINTCNMLIADH